MNSLHSILSVPLDDKIIPNVSMTERPIAAEEELT